jgi:hypothetical protein
MSASLTDKQYQQLFAGTKTVSKLYVNYANAFVKCYLLKVLLAVLVILLTGCGTTDNSRQHRPAPIRSTGVGSSFDEAKESAFKQAIENRIGVLVLSDREVQSYKLLKDEILTYSAGYVDDYVVVSQEKSPGAIIRVIPRFC